MNKTVLPMNCDMINRKYILNPNYILRNDLNRIILTVTGSKDFENITQENLATFIHPIHAMMLSFFKGDKTLLENLEEIAYFFNISTNSGYDLIYKFINNNKRVVVEYDNNFFYFPRMVLVEYEKKFTFRSYSVHDFNLKSTLDFDSTRFNIPIEASILLNNRCVTDCVYCYADKSNINDCKIPFERLIEVIEETKRLGFRNIDLQGGELFLYDYWYKLLKELFKAKYSIYISTKYPLSIKQIHQLKDLGVKEIQISLDSIFADDLKKNLNVNDNYLYNIINTIKELNNKNFRIKLKSVITSYIFNIERMVRYIEYFKQFQNICIIEFTAPSHTMYKTQEQFFSYRLTSENINEIKELVKNKREECHFKLFADISVFDKSFNLSYQEKKELFSKRSRCTGNQSSFLILPNGDVTICEKSYFNKNFIIGNILNDSIMDIWNSNNAKKLFYISKASFPKESECSKCLDFEQCRYNLGVCWIDVMAAYGLENWQYPSPNCPYAPKPKYITYSE